MSNSLDTSSCLLSLTALISNIIKIHFGISCGNAAEIFVGEKCEHFFRLNVCIGFRVSSTFGQSDGCMSDTPETMGGLSGVPNGTSSQTSASRGYVLFRGANKGHTQKVLQIVFRDADMTRGVLQTWKDTDHRRCKHPAG